MSNMIIDYRQNSFGRQRSDEAIVELHLPGFLIAIPANDFRSVFVFEDAFPFGSILAACLFAFSCGGTAEETEASGFVPLGTMHLARYLFGTNSLTNVTSCPQNLPENRPPIPHQSQRLPSPNHSPFSSNGSISQAIACSGTPAVQSLCVGSIATITDA